MSKSVFDPNPTTSKYAFNKSVTQRKSENLSKSTYKKDDLQFSTIVNNNISSGKSKLFIVVIFRQVLLVELPFSQKLRIESKISRY